MATGGKHLSAGLEGSLSSEQKNRGGGGGGTGAVMEEEERSGHTDVHQRRLCYNIKGKCWEERTKRHRTVSQTDTVMHH